jgi:hypothetical protein
MLRKLEDALQDARKANSSARAIAKPAASQITHIACP